MAPAHAELMQSLARLSAKHATAFVVEYALADRACPGPGSQASESPLTANWQLTLRFVAVLGANSLRRSVSKGFSTTCSKLRDLSQTLNDSQVEVAVAAQRLHIVFAKG